MVKKASNKMGFIFNIQHRVRKLGKSDSKEGYTTRVGNLQDYRRRTTEHTRVGNLQDYRRRTAEHTRVGNLQDYRRRTTLASH
jgi:hypothetical protein